MGCGLPKLKRSEDNSPGKIYSTLKRPQVETKVGVAYTYHFLDFVLGKEGATGLCLSSLRELPIQLQDLYQQGFVLAAVHPFIYPSGLEHTCIQYQLYRAVLIRHSDTSEKTQSSCESSHLEIDLCLPADQSPNAGLIQGYVKKIQDAAEQGIMFVGFVQQAGAVSARGKGDPEEMSLSLHSSPSSLPGTETDLNQSPISPEGLELQDCRADIGTEDKPPICVGEEVHLGKVETQTVNPGSLDGAGAADSEDGESGLSDPSSSAEQQDPHLLATDNNSSLQNNNKAKTTEQRDTSLSFSKKGMEVFALFNQPGMHQGLLKYYTIKVPLRVQHADGGVNGLEANWLDHMTQHFNSGASLVDGYFHLGSENDLTTKSVESVFIFQEGQEGDKAYDAIVVEQWTLINGIEVKTDYIPLLQSLAVYGWKLTCVLSTPIVKTNSDGSLSTKQIVFLQRPTLPRKKRDAKILGFKVRSKSNKNSVKDAPKYKKRKNVPSLLHKETAEQKICEDEERMSKEESESVVKKNNENQEKEGEKTAKLGNGKKEATSEAESEDRECGRLVDGGEEGETGKVGNTEQREDYMRDIAEVKEVRAPVEVEREVTVDVVTAQGREAREEAETEREVVLETKDQVGQSSEVVGQDGGASEKGLGGAENLEEMVSNGERQAEDIADCEGAKHVS